MVQRSFFYVNSTWINRKYIVTMREILIPDMPTHMWEITLIGGLKLYVEPEDAQRILVGVKQLGS